MNKFYKILFILAFGIILFNAVSLHTIDAKSKEIELHILFEEEVTVTAKTTKVDVGFARITFPKNFVLEDEYPITFTIKVYADDGDLYVEFDPDYEEFEKDVIIHIYSFEGYIYDVATDEYIFVEVPNQVFKVSHFSRWCFRR